MAMVGGIYGREDGIFVISDLKFRHKFHSRFSDQNAMRFYGFLVRGFSSSRFGTSMFTLGLGSFEKTRCGVGVRCAFDWDIDFQS
ncbi:hypothetical protein U1Q18_009764 [Sarracenia purpurea var. burkii]